MGAIVKPLAPTPTVAIAVPVRLALEIWDRRKALEEDAGVNNSSMIAYITYICDSTSTQECKLFAWRRYK